MNLLNLETSKSVKIKGIDFKIKAILNREEIEIGVKGGFLRNGLSVESMDMKSNMSIIKNTTIDVCAELPDKIGDWEIDTAADIADTDLRDQLYDAIVKFTSSIEKKLKKNKSYEGSSKA